MAVIKSDERKKLQNTKKTHRVDWKWFFDVSTLICACGFCVFVKIRLV
jgi:hypothetical protein